MTHELHSHSSNVMRKGKYHTFSIIRNLKLSYLSYCVGVLLLGSSDDVILNSHNRLDNSIVIYIITLIAPVLFVPKCFLRNIL